MKQAQRADEIFDMVNERDEVIGQRTRGEVHRLGLRHRAVHVLVFNGRGELFLQKRSLKKDTFPGAWDSSVRDTWTRARITMLARCGNCGRKSGWKWSARRSGFFKIEACEETGQEFVWVYRLEAEGPFVLHPEEIETGGWFTPEAITRGWRTGRKILRGRL